MNLLMLTFRVITRSLGTLFLIFVCAIMLFIAYRGNQPMHVSAAPDGMTYFQFMADRLDAAQTVKPARCGTGMIGSLFALGPFYATLYTQVALQPDSFMARVTAPDTDMPTNVANASWVMVPSIWWDTFERLSWTMLAKRHPGCNLRPVTAHQNSN